MSLGTRARLRGVWSPPGDKSISHRLAILSALARGPSELERFAPGGDCRTTLAILEALGVSVEREGERVRVRGSGYFGFRPAGAVDLQADNSGTTARLVAAVLAAQPFSSRLDGDPSLRRRPMQRVIEPLERMGARIESLSGRLPLRIEGGRRLRGIEYSLPVASAQVKTAVLLAGLHAEGKTAVREPQPTRNHTELALARFGVPVLVRDGSIAVEGGARLEPGRFRIPGDLSSAAFFVTAAALLPGSDLLVREVGLNPTRTGFLDVLRAMGADMRIEAEEQEGGEKLGTLRVRGSRLHGVEVPAEQSARLIDEIPILAVAAAFAEGETVFHGLGELRVKESDRLQAIVSGLSLLGAAVEPLGDGFRVIGGRPLHGARLESHRDHRMAMAWAIASLAIEDRCEIEDKDVVGISFPGFWEALAELAA